MADNIQLSAAVGVGDIIAGDEIGGAKYQRVKLIHGADGVNAGDVASANGLPVQPATGAAFPVTDNGGSLTVDAPVGTPVFVRLSDGSAAISTLPVSLASVPSHAVTNAGTFVVQVSSIAAGDNNIGNVDIVTVPADPFGANADAASATGSISAKLRFIASTGIPVTGTVTVDSELPAAAQITSENTAAPTAPSVYGFGMVFDGSNWDRMPGTSADGLLVNLGGNNDVDTELPAAAALSDTTANPTAPAVGGCLMVWTGAVWARGPGDATNGLLVNLGGNNDVTVTGSVTANAGTNLNTSALALEAGGNLAAAAASLAILDNCISGNEAQVDVITLPNVTLAAGTNTNEVVGDAAHGAAVAGNPLLMGLEGRSTAPTAVDDGDAVRALATLLGKLVNVPYALPANTWSYATATAGVTDTADDEAKAAGAAGVRNYVTSVQVINGHATVATEVVIKDGSTVLWRGWAEAVGGGVSAKFDPPLRGTAATAINVANITTGSKTYFNLQGFTATE